VSVISTFWERPLLPPPLRKLAETEVIVVAVGVEIYCTPSETLRDQLKFPLPRHRRPKVDPRQSDFALELTYFPVQTWKRCQNKKTAEKS
jgi:hypothetical protein